MLATSPLRAASLQLRCSTQTPTNTRTERHGIIVIEGMLAVSAVRISLAQDWAPADVVFEPRCSAIGAATNLVELVDRCTSWGLGTTVVGVTAPQLVAEVPPI